MEIDFLRAMYNPSSRLEGKCRDGAGQTADADHWNAAVENVPVSLPRILAVDTYCRRFAGLFAHSRPLPHLHLRLHHVLPGPPSSANLLTMLGPISSYSAFVWQ